MMTETEVTVEKGIGCYEMRCNHAFADLTHKNMEEVGALEYTEEEKEFAGKLQETVDEATLSSEQKPIRRARGGISLRDLPERLLEAGHA